MFLYTEDGIFPSCSTSFCFLPEQSNKPLLLPTVFHPWSVVGLLLDSRCPRRYNQCVGGAWFRVLSVLAILSVMNDQLNVLLGMSMRLSSGLFPLWSVIYPLGSGVSLGYPSFIPMVLSSLLILAGVWCYSVERVVVLVIIRGMVQGIQIVLNRWVDNIRYFQIFPDILRFPEILRYSLT